ncbi:MAG: glucan 1,4-alpha-glucosidase [Pyrinomonadaceae bacterium]
MFGLTCPALFGQTTNLLAPGAPGVDAHWPSAAKNGFGTSNSLVSKVWFTLTNGVMTEVFYPTLDVANTQVLEFIVCSAGQCVSEREDMTHRLQVLDSRALSFRQINRVSKGAFRITKTYTTDPQRSTVLIDVNLWSPKTKVSYELYLYYDPSLNNSGMHDTAWSTSQALFASDGNITSALVSSGGFDETSSGFAGTSDGLGQLKQQGSISERYERAENGNVAQVAKLGSARQFTIALAFGANPVEALANAQLSLKRGFRQIQREYASGWHAYISSLRKIGGRDQAQYNMAAMVLKGLEDKTHRGAMIASPSNPWGAGPNANEPGTTGYHAVWARDLYHVATAFLALGDRASAERALEYLFQLQQKPDGSFPQNSRVDGRTIGGAVQIDQTALPLVLAYQLGRTDRISWQKHIQPAADFIARKGPATDQERWEEESGYSPSTIAAAIAGLVCAARIAALNQDQQSAGAYLKKADEWAANVERWTATANGPYDSGKYYLRISENQDPNDGAKIEINSGGGSYDEREIVDAGFLELVRLGIKRTDEPLIVNSLGAIDRLIKVETPHGSAWYRYNHDAYGERLDGNPYDGRSGKGRPWSLLTGERGQFELAGGNRAAARQRLDSQMGFANEGLMIPEQIWDRADSPNRSLRFGEGTGSATPLAWSMAQFIRLAINWRDNRNLDTPEVVASRYLKRPVK